MSELNELYQEVILDHNRNPRNFREIQDTPFSAEGFNPLCGDKVTVFLKLTGDTIDDISFKGSGCAISTASASIMTGLIKGKTVRQAETIFNTFHALVTGKPSPVRQNVELEKLAVFHGVSDYPIRVKCATLAWHTLQAALKGAGQPVTTE